MTPEAWATALKILEATNCPLPLASLYVELLNSKAMDPEGWFVYLDLDESHGYGTPMWRARLTGEITDWGEKCVIEYSDGIGDFEHVCVARAHVKNRGRWGGWDAKLCEDNEWEYGDEVPGDWTEKVNDGITAALVAWLREQDARACAKLPISDRARALLAAEAA